MVLESAVFPEEKVHAYAYYIRIFQIAVKHLNLFFQNNGIKNMDLNKNNNNNYAHVCLRMI